MSEDSQLRLGAFQRKLMVDLLVRRARLSRVTVRVRREAQGVRETVEMPALVRGSGTPLVFLHGFGADKESWLLLLTRIAKGRALIALDLPGFGAATAIDPALATAKWQAEAVVLALAQLGVDRAHFVGSSMGGAIAQRVDKDFPGRVLSSTLLGSAASVGEKSELGHALDRGENPLLVRSPEDFYRLVGWTTSVRPFIPRPMALHLGKERADKADVEAALFAGFAFGPKDERMVTDLEALGAPTLVIHGEEDRVIHPSTARLLAERIPNARLVMLPRVGHLPHVERGGFVAARIESFAREHDPRA